MGTIQVGLSDFMIASSDTGPHVARPPSSSLSNLFLFGYNILEMPLIGLGASYLFCC